MLREYPEGRRCEKCGKPLSIYNPSTKCFRCDPVMIKALDDHGRPVMTLAETPVIGAETLCSSRETRGFDQAYTDYQGCGPDHS